MVAAFLAVNYYNIHKETFKLAKKVAREHFNTSQAIRFWAATHGGVYVPVSENAVPNPYLAHIPERDILSTAGKRFTLMNPAYLLRVLNENYGEMFGIKGHLTSLKLMRPENAPDMWERKALESFEQGNEEMIETVKINNKPHLRLMRPLYTEKSCLRCHSHQGYKVGDIRGGLSISVPLDDYYTVERHETGILALIYGLLWILGIAGIFLAGKRLEKDTRDQEKAEAELRQSHERLFTVLNSLNALVYVTDMKIYEILFVNQQVQDMFGDVVGKVCWQTLQVNQDGPCDFCKNDKIVTPDGQPSETCVWEFHSPLTNRHYYVSDRAIQWSDGRIVKLQIATDISERKKTEEELTRLATAIEQSADQVIMTDTEARIQYVNPAFEKITGYKQEEVLGANPRVLKSGKHDDVFFKNLWETITQGNVWSGRLTNKKKNGELYEEDASISPIKEKSGKIIGFVAVKRDITKEVQLEKQVRQSQKLEAIGKLAGGIAHDFNNILTGIIGYSQFALEKTPEDSQAAPDLKEVLKASNRAKELVKQILTFSRQTEQELRSIQPDLVVKEAIKLMRASLPATIEIQAEINENAGIIKADPTQISQVIMNLLTNAEHAMRGKGGTLGVSLKAVEIDEEIATSHEDLQPGPYIQFSISDTGTGMTQEIINHIFEPFFTTKEKGEGTGMGLATLHGIVKNHEGAVNVYSELGKGSTFNIYLPETESSREEKEKVSRPLPTGSERIMIVDDEETLAPLGKRRLEGLRYEVTALTSSVEALKIFMENPQRFDLVITDQTMPKITGDVLAQELLKIRPDIPIILCTGFSHSITPEKAKAMGIRDFLMKPIITSDLAVMVRKALDLKTDV